MNKACYLLLLFYIWIASCEEIKSLQELPSHYVDFEQGSVHYKVSGEGEKKLVFIHGWGCDMNTWAAQFGQFEDEVQMVFIDLPGYGKSSKPAVNYTMDLFAESIHAVLQKLSINDPILIGHSLGYPVSRQVIRNYPKLSPKLCIVDGVYFKIPTDSTSKIVYKAQMDSFAGLFVGLNSAQSLNAFIQSLFVQTSPQHVKDYVDTTMKRVEAHVGHNTMLNLIEEKIWQEDILAIPTLALYANIPELPADNEVYLRKLYPNLTYQAVDGVGHFLMMENPKKFNEILAGFIRE